MKARGKFYISSQTNVDRLLETEAEILRLLEAVKHHPGGCMYQSLRVEAEALIRELRGGVISDNFFSRLTEFFRLISKFI